MADRDTTWNPPLYLYAAGRHAVESRDYSSEPASRHLLLRRVLIQRALSGEGVVFAEGEKHRVPAGSMFVIERPGRYGYRYEGDGTPWEVEYASIVCDTPTHLLPPECMRAPIVSTVDHPQVGNLLAELVDAHYAGQSALALAGMSYRLVLATIHAMQRARAPAGWVDDVARAIDERFDTPLSLADLARASGVAHETMIRVFRRVYGVTPGGYLLQARVRRARQMLERTREPLKRIAVACGFASANYFGRVFRREVGCTPSEYRANPNPLG